MQNIKVEAEHVEVKEEDDVSCQQKCSVDIHLETCLGSVNDAHDERGDHKDILQFPAACQLQTWPQRLNESTKVKQEMTNRNECDRDAEDTKRWVVCEAGVLKLLKEFKVEHTQSVSDTYSTKDYCENIDHKQKCSNTNNKQISKKKSNIVSQSVPTSDSDQLQH